METFLFGRFKDCYENNYSSSSKKVQVNCKCTFTGEHRVVDYLTKLEHTIKKKYNNEEKETTRVARSLNDMIIYFNVSLLFS